MIDTASNYRGGRGEKAVGYALNALQDKLGLTREMLFISTKAGFLQDEVKSQVCHLTHNAFFVVITIHARCCMEQGCLLLLMSSAMLQMAKQICVHSGEHCDLHHIWVPT